jgi:hypothetical protein
VHSVLFQIVRGALPAGKELDHLCRHHPCCDWEHLEAVTHAVNMRRSSLAKLSDDQRAEIIASAGLGPCALGRKYGVRSTTIMAVLGTRGTGRKTQLSPESAMATIGSARAGARTSPRRRKSPSRRKISSIPNGPRSSPSDTGRIPSMPDTFP